MYERQEVNVIESKPWNEPFEVNISASTVLYNFVFIPLLCAYHAIGVALATMV